MKNYYEILGVSENAPNSEIVTAYEQLTKKYHPENFVGEAKELVEHRVNDIKEAYSVLSDDFLRNQYDKERGIDTSIRVEKELEEEKTKPKKRKAEKEEKQKKQGFIERRREKRKNKPKVGTVVGLKNVTQQVFKNFSQFKIEKPTKKSALAMLAAIAIVLLIGLILWFIPFTNGFMRSFLLLNS